MKTSSVLALTQITLLDAGLLGDHLNVHAFRRVGNRENVGNVAFGGDMQRARGVV